jgi:hypothetical protein
MQTSLLLKGIIFGAIAQTLTFLQFQGGIKYGWADKYPWVLAIGGIPISYLFMQSVKFMVLAYGGQIWPSRLIGFSVGMIVFTAMSYLLFKEPITTKTFVCLILSLVIITLQVLWK